MALHTRMVAKGVNYDDNGVVNKIVSLTITLRSASQHVLNKLSNGCDNWTRLDIGATKGDSLGS